MVRPKETDRRTIGHDLLSPKKLILLCHSILRLVAYISPLKRMILICAFVLVVPVALISALKGEQRRESQENAALSYWQQLSEEERRSRCDGPEKVLDDWLSRQGFLGQGNDWGTVLVSQRGAPAENWYQLSPTGRTSILFGLFCRHKKSIRVIDADTREAVSRLALTMSGTELVVEYLDYAAFTRAAASAAK